MLVLHILFASFSLIITGLALAQPSRGKLNVSYGLISGTLLSGIALVILGDVSILRTCLTGLTFLAAELAATTIVKRRLQNNV